MVVVRCKVCGCDFSVIPSRHKRGQVKYCSIGCYSKAKRGVERKPELRRNCIVCGKRFLPHYNQRTTEGWGKYCSLGCYHQAINSDTKLKCDYCGKEFTRKRYKLNRNGVRHHYCSPDCRNKANRGENYNPNRVDYRDGQFKRLAKKLREEAKFCHDCKRESNKYQVHHLIPPWMFDSRKEAHDPSNLVILCVRCHRRRHRNLHSIVYGMIKCLVKENDSIRREFLKKWNDH